MLKLTITPIAAQDLADAAQTIALGDISTCDWLSHWVSTATFLEWARRGFQEGDSYGLSNALCYAKRAACCRIDMLLQYNHLTPFSHKNYPTKIAALEQIGLNIPSIVHELVIDPRNEMEHDYQTPDNATARRAVDIADLFIRATDAEHKRASIVAVNWNVMGSHALANAREYVNFRESTCKPMLFIDVFETSAAAKIVDPANEEMRFAELNRFTDDQAIELARHLRENYSLGSFSESRRGRGFYQEMKRQAGF
jgi:hypothetical protein